MKKLIKKTLTKALIPVFIMSNGLGISVTPLLSNLSTAYAQEVTTGVIDMTLSKIDSTKWQYNAEDNVYYQIGILYVEATIDKEQQTLSIFYQENI